MMQGMDIHWVGINVGNGFSRHNHVNEGVYEFHFLLENAGVFSNDGRDFAGKAGTLLLSNPTAWHRAWVNKQNESMTIYSVSFLPEVADASVIRLLEERFAADPELAIGKGYALVFEDMRRKFVSGDILQKQSANYRLLSFIFEILSGQTRTHPPRGQMYVDEALVIMQGNIAGMLDFDELVGRLGIDKSYFIRVFKQIMGVPPLKYYLSLKMDAAGHSLRDSQKPIHQIAAEFGYSDEYYFSRIFKTHVGMSPQEFRTRH